MTSQKQMSENLTILDQFEGLLSKPEKLTFLGMQCSCGIVRRGMKLAVVYHEVPKFLPLQYEM